MLIWRNMLRRVSARPDPHSHSRCRCCCCRWCRREHLLRIRHDALIGKWPAGRSLRSSCRLQSSLTSNLFTLNVEEQRLAREGAKGEFAAALPALGRPAANRLSSLERQINPGARMLIRSRTGRRTRQNNNKGNSRLGSGEGDQKACGRVGGGWSHLRGGNVESAHLLGLARRVRWDDSRLAGRAAKS